jgi:hypothetical protein
MGPYQNGLTTIVTQLRKNYMENQNFTSFNLAISKAMAISTFQMRIEMNMVFKTDNHVMPISNRTCIVQIDDLNLAQA